MIETLKTVNFWIQTIPPKKNYKCVSSIFLLVQRFFLFLSQKKPFTTTALSTSGPNSSLTTLRKGEGDQDQRADLWTCYQNTMGPGYNSHK